MKQEESLLKVLKNSNRKLSVTSKDRKAEFLLIADILKIDIPNLSERIVVRNG